MARTPAVLREAAADDAEALVEIWGGVLRRVDHEQQLADVRRIVADAAEDPGSRIVVAECEGAVAGAAYLRITTMTPINLEPVVLTLSPHVLPDHRRRGVWRALMDAGVAWAEENGIAHVATAAVSGARDANRFMARLALAPQALLRVAPTSAVRAKLTPQPVRRGNRQVSQVLAARRSQRQRPSGIPSRSGPVLG